MRMTKQDFWVLLLVTVAALTASNLVRAEALFVPIVDGKVWVPPPGPRPQPNILPVPSQLPFRVTSSKVDVRIDENIATTSMEQSFLNQSGRDLEVRVMIPLPAGAAINNSALSMNNEMVEGKLYDAGQAQSIYESIVMQRRDPALLRFAGENLYEARIFPIPPNQERRLKFSYTQVLPSAGGLYDYKHILSGSQMYQNGIEKFELNCTIHSQSALGPIFSPSHQVAIQRQDANTAKLQLSGSNLSSDRDFRLYYSPSSAQVALRLITHRASDSEDGYFMLIGRADDQLENSQVLPKELMFVVDTSGSMQGEKMTQTKNALKFCLNTLNEHDRFGLISFSTEVVAFAGGNLQDATKENVNKALQAVEQLEASGGTNIDEALRAALGANFTAGSAKAKMIIFMTDGLPTVGNTDMAAILKNTQEANQKQKVRIFNFGVGNDVNTHLLDKLALDHEGVSTYISPREDIEVKVSDLANKIRHPVMTEVAFDFGTDSGVNSVYPKKIPALYRGGEVLLVGRFKGSAPGQLTLNGSVGGEARKISVKADWTARNLDNSFLPRVWAMRKVGHLLEDIRLHGQNPESTKEIVELAQRFGIVTPYTSQLVLEPGMPNQQLGWRGGAQPPMPPMSATDALSRNAKNKEEAGRSAAESFKRAEQAQVGATANAIAMVEKELKDAAPAAPAMVNEPRGGGFGGMDKATTAERKVRLREALAVSGKAPRAEDAEALERAETELVKHIGARTFYQRGGIWVDSTAAPDAKPTVIKTFSKEYFELLKNEPELGPVLALGGKILVTVKETLYQIEE